MTMQGYAEYRLSTIEYKALIKAKKTGNEFNINLEWSKICTKRNLDITTVQPNLGHIVELFIAKKLETPTKVIGFFKGKEDE